MGNTSRDFRKLKVWQAARGLAKAVYVATEELVAVRQYGLADQMQRAAVSVAANIAEGCGRGGNRELHRFMEIAQGSNAELRCLVVLAHDVGLMERKRAASLYRSSDEVGKMLTAYCAQLRKSDRLPENRPNTTTEPPNIAR